MLLLRILKEPVCWWYTYIHNAVLFNVEEKPIIEQRKLGIRRSDV